MKNLISTIRKAMTTSGHIDLTHIYFCPKDNMCMLRTDLDELKKCGRCGGDVSDVTHSPVGIAWLAIVRPYSKRWVKREGPTP